VLNQDSYIKKYFSHCRSELQLTHTRRYLATWCFNALFFMQYKFHV